MIKPLFKRLLGAMAAIFRKCGRPDGGRESTAAARSAPPGSPGDTAQKPAKGLPASGIDHEDDRLLNSVLGEGILTPEELERVKEAQRRIRRGVEGS